MPLYRARTCFCLLLSHQWLNEKIFQLILYACERGIHTKSVWGQELFGGVPATNVLNICWHDSPLLDGTESFSSHRCLRVWQSNSGSTQGADHGQGSPESSQSEQQVKVNTDVVIELNNIESNLNRQRCCDRCACYRLECEFGYYSGDHPEPVWKLLTFLGFKNRASQVKSLSNGCCHAMVAAFKPHLLAVCLLCLSNEH